MIHKIGSGEVLLEVGALAACEQLWKGFLARGRELRPAEEVAEALISPWREWQLLMRLKEPGLLQNKLATKVLRSS